jgi:hypothetical protein
MSVQVMPHTEPFPISVPDRDLSDLRTYHPIRSHRLTAPDTGAGNF